MKDKVHYKVDKQPVKKRSAPAADIIHVGILFAVSFWIIDSIVDTVVFEEGDFTRNLISPDPIEVWMRLTIMGLIIGISVYAKHLITVRERAGADLKLFRELINQSNDAIFVIDPETSLFLDVNDKACTNLGYGRDELLKLGVVDIEAVIPDGFSWKEHVKEVRTEGYQVLDGAHKRKDGTTFPVEINVRSIPHGERDYMVAVARDITGRRRVEEEKQRIQGQLFQMQKLEGIGILAGGVAHNFNNLMTVIKGYAELAFLRVGKSDPLSKYLEEILLAVDRSTELVGKLLLFAQKKSIEPGPLNINGTIENLLKMLDHLTGEEVTIRTELERKPLTALADERSIEQVLLNLAVNARDAMAEGGVLTIKTENITLDEEDSRLIPESRAGEFVLLSAADTGAGMDDEVLKHIFEPFFTTRDVGSGTGLGLSFVYGIIKQHDGWIHVRSAPGKGSTFNIFLPTTPANHS